MRNKFQTGFVKRAMDFGLSHEQALFLAKSADFSEAMSGLKEMVYPHTKDSLFSLSNQLEPGIVNSGHKDLHEILNIAKHIGSQGVVPGILGAGAGAVAGRTFTKDKKNRNKNTLLGALAGGGLGFGSGAFHDAKNLGQNTQAELRREFSNALDAQTKAQEENSGKMWPFRKDDTQFTQQIGRANANLEAVDTSHWSEMYRPNHMMEKLY